MRDFKEEWACCFCLTVFDGENHPDFCPACHVAFCRNCGTWVKGDEPKWCHGCGKIKPPAEGRFTRTSSTASVYLQEEWIRRNLNREGNRFTISSGYKDATFKEMGVWLVKENPDGTRTDVRALTDEERTYLGYRTQAELDAALQRLQVDKGEATPGRSNPDVGGAVQDPGEASS
jgi:hypothetical protein